MKKKVLLIFVVFLFLNSITTLAMDLNNNNNKNNNNGYGKLAKDIWSEIISFLIPNLILANTLPELKDITHVLCRFMQINKSCNELVHNLLREKLNSKNLKDFYFQRKNKILMDIKEKLKNNFADSAYDIIYEFNWFNNINDKEEKKGQTALILSALHGHDDLVELLIKNGADINIKDNNRWDALKWAELNAGAYRSIPQEYNRFKKVVELLEKTIQEKEFNDTYIDGNYYRSHDCLIQ